MIDPQDIDPDTGRPYANYSSPAIDTSFHDAERDDGCCECGAEIGPHRSSCDECGALVRP